MLCDLFACGIVSALVGLFDHLVCGVFVCCLGMIWVLLIWLMVCACA